MSKLVILSCFVIMACNNGIKTKQTDKAYILNFSDSTTVMFFLNTECPICLKYQGNFRQLINKFNQTTAFYFIFPGRQSEQSIADYCQYDSIPDEFVVKDTNYSISKSFGAEITPQVMVYKNRQLYYAGKIDDRFESISSFKTNASINYIEKALISLHKNEPVEIKKTIPVGCFIEPD